MTGAAAWATNRLQYPQDGNDLLHLFFRVLQITHAWAAVRRLCTRPPSAAIVTVYVGTAKLVSSVVEILRIFAPSNNDESRGGTKSLMALVDGFPEAIYGDTIDPTLARRAF
jgi:hypothetical protein